MKAENFLSLKDYFNYYISGLVWCAVFFELWLLINPNALAFLPNNLSINYLGSGGWAIIGVILIFLPFAIGFSLFPFSACLINLWQGGKSRLRMQDPKKEALWHGKSATKLKWLRIPEAESDEIAKRAAKVFGFSYSKNRSDEKSNDKTERYFYPVRSYVKNQGGEAAELAERALHLKNFTESLLWPVSLFTLFLIILICNRMWYGDLLGLVFAAVLQWQLMERHYELEKIWVKHVYRAFLVLTNEKS